MRKARARHPGHAASDALHRRGGLAWAGPARIDEPAAPAIHSDSLPRGCRARARSGELHPVAAVAPTRPSCRPARGCRGRPRPRSACGCSPTRPARRCSRARCAVDAEEDVAAVLVEVEGAGAERVVEAGLAVARQFRLEADHRRCRRPCGPHALAADLGDAAPGEALPADADAVAHAPGRRD